MRCAARQARSIRAQQGVAALRTMTCVCSPIPWRVRSLAVLRVLLLAVCIGCTPEPKALRKSGALAVLEGRVRLAPGAQMPTFAAPDLARQPLQANGPRSVPDECAPAQRAALQPVATTADAMLAGIVVAASDFTHYSERKSTVHHVAVAGCRLQPSVVAAMGGDFIDLENRDAFAFSPLLGPAFKATPLRKGGHMRMSLSPGTVESILCSRDAPCGRTDLIVFHHPVYAVTDAHGSFRIPNFPAAELVRITAWHPLFEESETFVWLKPGEHGAVELMLTPRKRFLPGATLAQPKPATAR